ncbi:hypothetical protein CI238_03037 [Colletotrichum incanum]|uniref:Uncharacterized protein n=1 Tax=Colletotrichum incanum TaxID=1573173 RepID=A0A167EII2_COLIC|nr:hypothetical protein CI238_03037 [Colletotrichum incanum]
MQQESPATPDKPQQSPGQHWGPGVRESSMAPMPFPHARCCPALLESHPGLEAIHNGELPRVRLELVLVLSLSSLFKLSGRVIRNKRNRRPFICALSSFLGF